MIMIMIMKAVLLLLVVVVTIVAVVVSIYRNEVVCWCPCRLFVSFQTSIISLLIRSMRMIHVVPLKFQGAYKRQQYQVQPTVLYTYCTVCTGRLDSQKSIMAISLPVPQRTTREKGSRQLTNCNNTRKRLPAIHPTTTLKSFKSGSKFLRVW